MELDVILVVFTVSLHFLQPEGGVGLGDSVERAIMPMPKAAMDEYHCMVAWQEYVWFPGQGIQMESVSKTLLVKQSPDSKLRGSILTSDPTHDAAPDLCSDSVCHDLIPLRARV